MHFFVNPALVSIEWFFYQEPFFLGLQNVVVFTENELGDHLSFIAWFNPCGNKRIDTNAVFHPLKVNNLPQAKEKAASKRSGFKP